MKKFTKGMLIAAGIFGAVGIGLTAAGGVMGSQYVGTDRGESLKGCFWWQMGIMIMMTAMIMMDDDDL